VIGRACHMWLVEHAMSHRVHQVTRVVCGGVGTTRS
jgi:hypothetical protein